MATFKVFLVDETRADDGRENVILRAPSPILAKRYAQRRLNTASRVMGNVGEYYPYRAVRVN